MSRRCFLAALFVTAVAGSLPASAAGQASGTEADRLAVLAAVETFFTSMTARDVDAARTVLEPQGRFFSTRTATDGTRSVRTFTNQEYLDGLPAGGAEQRERMWDAQVRIHGDIATVWGAYDFHVDGTFSHCGVDAFDLIRTPEGWKITGGVYTVQRAGCAPSPLGPIGPSGS